MKRIIVVILFFSFCSYLICFADDVILTNTSTNTTTNTAAVKQSKLNNYFGLYLTQINGFNISYRYWNGNLGLQLSLAPSFSYLITDITAGIAILKGLIIDPKSRFFIYYGITGSYVPAYSDGKMNYLCQIDSSGGGVGIEYILDNKISLNLMFGLEDYIGVTDIISLVVSTSLFYRF